MHGIGAVALSLVRQSTHPTVLPVVPGRGPWPARQGFRHRVAGIQGLAPRPEKVWGVGRVVVLVLEPPESLHCRGLRESIPLWFCTCTATRSTP